MSKINIRLFSRLSILLVIFLSFLFLFEKNLQAQDPIPVANPGPNTDFEPPAAEPNIPPPNQQPEPVENPGPTTTQPTTSTTDPSISPIGDLDPDTTNTITITGLESSTTYAVVVKKVRSIDQKPLFGGNKEYATVSTECLDSVGGRIEKKYNPFRLPGFYRLDIFKGNSAGGSCNPSGSVLVSQEFSIGGPIPGSSNVGSILTQECCDSGIPNYDRDRDVCKKFVLPLIGTESTNPTICKQKNSYCEPESLKCFKKPTTTQPTTNNMTPATNSGNPQISVPPVVDPDNPQPVTISGLDTNTMYSIEVEKLIYIDRRLVVQFLGGDKKYTRVFLQCQRPDETGQIVVINSTLTFLRIPGFYTLKLSKGHMEGKDCKSDNKLVEKKFTVGNPSNPDPAQARACCNYPKWVYSPSTDTCDAPHLITTAADKTECAKYESTAIYCEPQSQTCFDKKTNVSGDRICREPAPGTDFDLTTVPPKGLDKYAVCGASGGQRIEGCNDPTKPGYDPKHPAIATAIGCIPTNPPELVQAFMTFIIGISGGLAFLLMILGAFQMLTSAGNPETLHAGRERLTSAIIGLLIVIFATLLLQIIGFDILQIPGFKR